MADTTYRLYGGEISLYTGKVRAYLHFKGIDFEEIPATRDVYRNIILPRVGWPVIPVVVTPDDVTLQDTSDIIDALEARFDAVPVVPVTPRQRVVSLLLECWGDQWLTIPAMHYRWNHNTDWIIRQFGALSRPEASAEEQYAAGEQTCRPFRGSLPVLGVLPETHAAIESSYETLLHDLDAHFAEQPFLLGTRPSIGDYGLLGPLYAHNYRDPASGALMKRIAPRVARWVERMNAPSGEPGAFLDDDVIPATLTPVLQRIVDEQFPVLSSTVEHLQQWLQSHPEEPIPRAIGMHDFTLLRGTPLEVTAQRGIFPFDQWMLQRPRDALDALTSADRHSVLSWLQGFGDMDPLQRPLPRRVQRSHFQLVRAEGAE